MLGRVSIQEFHISFVDTEGNTLTHINITFDQLIADRTALLGVIVGISCYQVATEIVCGYADTNDGIAAFIALLKRYMGSICICCLKLSLVLATPYTPAYSGGKYNTFWILKKHM